MYTKGEWAVEHEFNVFCGNRLVASCGGYADNWKTEEVHNENVSNALLIASAPDMYEALDFIVMAWNNENVIADGVKEIAIQKAIAAINKAEGK